MRDVVIVGAARTPIGSFQGSLASLPAWKLGSVAIEAALTRSGLARERWGEIDEVLMGNVLQAGQGQAPARQALRAAGIPDSVGATTVHKVCGSGMKTVLLGATAIKAGEADIIVAGGMESMSNAPYLLRQARDGYRMGHGKIEDSMILDGLWDPYKDQHMGNCGELCARERGFSREAQDAFTLESYRRATAAIAEGLFKDEIAPVEIPQKKGPAVVFSQDEEPARGNPAKVPSLSPVFQKDGTITAASASKINDGASATVLMSAERAAALGLTPLARIVSVGHHAQAPEWFTTAPAGAIGSALKKAGLSAGDISAFEIN
ncbi:MAG: acetyl-CoA C-acyltransferase, partial [Deltaproteobacteria bacterium]|nr:acetyl-CoA C-acyltransferase [Deltaproteobacteria bacterium]